MSGRKIGVYVCQCGGNIGDYVDVDKVVDEIKGDDDVVVARSAMFTCSDATQQEIVQDVQEQGLDALVVASCSPKLHTMTFRDVAKRAGMNPFQYTQVNVREQCSWTHTDDKTARPRRPSAWCGPASTAPGSPSRSSRSSSRRRPRASWSAAASPACARPSGWPRSASPSSSWRRRPSSAAGSAGFGHMYPARPQRRRR